MLSGQSNFDVCVVGGGPGGVMAAYAIARAGYSVIILDKKPRERIGEKNCGDALDGLHVEILEKELGINPPQIDVGEARELIKKITIAAVDLDTKFTAETPGYLVDRLAYGQRLLNDAEKNGAVIRPQSIVREIMVEDSCVVGVKYFDQDRKLKQLRAKITIDASGYVGAVRKLLPEELTLGVSLQLPDDVSIGTYREIIQLNGSADHNFREEIILWYHKSIPPPGYAWIFSEGEKMLNIGITWVKGDIYPSGKTMKQIYHECLDPIISPDDYEVIHKGGGNIPMRPNFDSLAFNGVMIVGDAGSLADCTTFEGHGPALESGRLAGKTAITALKHGKFSHVDLWQYNVDIMKYPGGMHAQSYLVAQLMRKIGAKNLQFILEKEIITEAELRDIFQEKNANLTFFTKLRKFIRAFPRWGTMLTIKKYLNLIEKAELIYNEYPKDPTLLDEWRSMRNKLLKLNF